MLVDGEEPPAMQYMQSSSGREGRGTLGDGKEDVRGENESCEAARDRRREGEALRPTGEDRAG